MNLEYRIPFVQPDWMPLRATTLEQANRELEAMLPHSEEAQVRDTDGRVLNWTPPAKRNEPNFGP